MSWLREETQQRIQVVNRKFNGLSICVFESLELRVSETKQNRTEMSKKLHDHRKVVDSNIDNMQTEIVNLRQKLIEDNLRVLEEKLEAKINDLEDSRLEHFESRLDQLSGRFTAVCGTS